MAQSRLQRIRTVVFWLGGTVLPPLEETVQRIIRSADAGAPSFRELRSLCDNLTWGVLSPQAFFERFPCASAPLEDFLRFAPLPGTEELIADLVARVKVGFVSDYPRAWILRTSADSQWSHLLPMHEMVYTSELGLSSESLSDRLLGAGVVEAGNTLWVDRRVPRALALLRAGIDVSLCADAARLRRDLVLWRLLSG